MISQGLLDSFVSYADIALKTIFNQVWMCDLQQ